MTNTSTLTKLIGFAALAGATSIAQAGPIETISSSSSFNFGQTIVQDNESSGNNNSIATNSQTQSVYLDGFDSSLGTLTGVEITFNSNWSLRGTLNANDIDQWYNWAEQTSGSAYAAGNYGIQLVDPAGQSQVEASATHLSCSASEDWWPSNVSCSDTENASGNFNGSLDASTIDLAEFIGDDLRFDVTRLLTAEITGCGDGDDNCSVTNSNNYWAGTLDIKYSYDVPEPTTLALFSIGLIGLGMARRKQK